MNSKIQTFKQELNRVFDDNLRTKQWHNFVDYAIIGFIVLSTVEVFLSTYDGIVERYGTWLHAIDYLTTAFFTIEVTLRIWCADLLDPKYKGFWGRVRYCFSFYGLIDILSTYPFYLHFFMPIPYVALKALRIARLLRIFRYMKAFSILSRAIRAKKNEMMVSLQFLTIVTLILSFVLFFVEHAAQPEVYDNGWTSVVWAFAQYIGDPGGFADTPPITFTGRIIACIIGVLGIAIFAVPAGLIGSAFTEVMEKDEKKEKIEGWAEKLQLAFERKLDRLTGFQIVPRYLSVMEIQARLGLKENEIIDAVASSNEFRLTNIACTRPADEHPEDKLAVEHYSLNTCYGQCIDRGSKITIFAPSNIVDPITGWWAYYVAQIGGFNYVSREIGQKRPYQSFYNYDASANPKGGKECMEDLNRLANSKEHWIVTLLAASGANEPNFPTQFHFTYGAKKGDEAYNDPNITINDIDTFEDLYQDFSNLLENKYQLFTDKQRYHTNASSKFFARQLENKINAISLRVAWSVTCWDMRAIQLAQEFATVLNKHVNKCENPTVADLKKSGIGYNAE